MKENDLKQVLEFRSMAFRIEYRCKCNHNVTSQAYNGMYKYTRKYVL